MSVSQLSRWLCLRHAVSLRIERSCEYAPGMRDYWKLTMKRVLMTHNGLVATVLAPPAIMAERTWRYKGALAS